MASSSSERLIGGSAATEFGLDFKSFPTWVDRVIPMPLPEVAEVWDFTSSLEDVAAWRPCAILDVWSRKQLR